MKLIISGIFIHLIFMGAIFDVYFKSPIITGLQPQNTLKSPPAKRIVLIVADGLRAESLFGQNASNLDPMAHVAPYLRGKITESQACWGISHTRVPTESRPGHVALTAGIYEDPSAIAKGWKENPVEFDSVFNESYHTWAWGSPDIVPMFKKSLNVEGFSYSPEQEDFSGKISTRLLDDWVFERVIDLFQTPNDKEQRNLLNSDRVIFFLHLLGLDTAGHTHKPGSEKHISNIKSVDFGISRIEQVVSSFYNDDKGTAYIFTADHGMTNWGSHGAGSKHETETPFIAWGAGLKPSLQPINMAQADIAPLISTLIGIPIPVNSIGVLPVDILNMTNEDIARAYLANAKQIYTQYEEKQRRTEENSIRILYKPFPNLSKQEFKNIITVVENAVKEHDFNYVMKACNSIIQASLNGLDYYQNYYQRLLLTFLVITYFGWIGILLLYLTETSSENIFERQSSYTDSYIDHYLRRPEINMCINLIFILIILGAWILIYVQSLPMMYYLYLSLPLYLWWHIIEQCDLWLSKFQAIFQSYQYLYYVFGNSLFYLVGIETLVLSFFYRESLSFTLIIMALWPYFLQKINFSIKIIWTVSCWLLAVFPFLPVVGSNFNLYLIVFSTVIWILTGFGSIFINYFTDNPKHFFVDRNQMIMAVLQGLTLAVTVYNLYSIDTSIQNKNGLAWHNQYISWALSVISLFLSLCGPNLIIGRLVNISMGLLIPFILLSVCYEPLFLLVLFFNLMLWLYIEHKEYSPIFRNLALMPFREVSHRRRSISITRNEVYAADFRRGFFIVVYAVLAFFGMGNMASLNSFDPMWVRNFVTVFSPFLMMSLILFKTLIPYLLLSCVFRAVTTCMQAPVKKMFFIVLVFCDVMGLHFLFMVRNTGSWLEIGSSISHYIIVQVMVLFLLLLYMIAIPLTNSDVLSHKKSVPMCPFKVHSR